jgi:hypothetical protein
LATKLLGRASAGGAGGMSKRGLRTVLGIRFKAFIWDETGIFGYTQIHQTKLIEFSS